MSIGSTKPTASSIEPRNVAMLVSGAEVYGIGTIVKLYAMGWDEATFVCFGEGPMHDWLRDNGSRVELITGVPRFAARQSVAAIFRYRAQQAVAKRAAEEVRRRLADTDALLVHTHRLTEQIIAGYLRPKGYKSVWQINNNMNRRRLAGFGRVLNHRLARWGADLLLPASDFIGDNWQGCGVPMQTVRNAANKVVDYRDAPPPPPVRCLVAGRMDETKGHHVAVAAVLKARAAGHAVSLDIFGGPLEDNSYADDLKKEIEAAGASGAIRFQGFCADLRQRHGDYHLGFQCRIDPEPCSLWVCETMVDGLPLLASATGGTPELVDDGKTGLLYPAGDADALAARLIELCEAPDRLATMRTAAFQRGQAGFTDIRFRNETLEAYASAFGA